MIPQRLALIRIRAFFLGLTLGLISLGQDSALAGHFSPRQHCQSRWLDGAGGGGGEVPTPFSINRHFELADQELYVLTGTVGILSDEPDETPRAYLQIDLDKAPWLANHLRVKTPYYRLKGYYTSYLRANRKTITHLYRAHGIIENQQYSIELEPITLPNTFKE